MRIQAAGPKFNVALNVSEPSADCKGSIEGQATLAKDTLTMIKMNNGEICNLSITFDGFEARIFEDNCPAFKGMACSFVGSLNRQK